MRILAVDDDKILLDILREGLATLGLTNVTCAQSGAEALAIVADDPTAFDCFLLDIMMPEMDGITLCENLRRLAGVERTPILMITSSEAKKFMRQAFDAGATDYLRKPLDPVELEARIRGASLLSDTLARELDSRRALKSAMSAAPTEGAYDPAERINFDGIPGMADYYEIENRLLRLGAGLFSVSLYSVQIRGFHRVAQTTTPARMRELVRMASFALSRTIPNRNTFFAYIGQGNFVCTVFGRNHAVPQLWQARLRDAFNTSELGQEDRLAETLLLDLRSISNRRIFTVQDALGQLNGVFLKGMDQQVTATAS